MQRCVDGVEQLVTALDLPFVEGALAVSPPPDVYGSPFRVTDAAVVAIATAVYAVACLDAARRDASVLPVAVDGRHAAVAFSSERLLAVPALDAAALWDPLARNYRACDGWVRLHTNVAAHRAAVLEVLGAPADPAAVADAAARWRAGDLEDAVVRAGGVAAQLRTLEQWAAHPQRSVVLDAPPIALRAAGDPGRGVPPGGRVLDGVRVIDLTRVIAGPVAGRFLASFGADVLRVDAPHLDDMLAFEIDTGFGKRRRTLDLRVDADRAAFDSLIADADVVLEAFRPRALAGLGYDDGRLQQLRPGLVTGHLSAYGDAGPWAGRRGFDSVVQVACGIAHACGFDPRSGPRALPAQALDHACGYLLAAGVLAGLVHRERDGLARTVSVSLARTAEWLVGLGVRAAQPATPVDDADVGELLAWRRGTAWGDVRHVRPTGRVGDRAARWELAPAPRER